MFPKDQVYCVLDYETYSELPLKKVGSYEYSKHPSTDIICLAWKIGTKADLPSAPISTWASDNRVPSSPLDDLVNALWSDEVILVAHNALFEQLITSNVLPKYTSDFIYDHPPPKRWLCTASMAAAMALPRKLEHAAQVMGCKTQKDMAGNRLIQKWCKPRKPSKKNPSTRHTDLKELERIISYCKDDVQAETELFLKLKMPTPKERKIWIMDQEINQRGFMVDRPLVKKTLKLIEEETKLLNKKTAEITGGLITSANQRDAILGWLRSEGLHLPDLQRKTVEDILEFIPESSPLHTILLTRLASSKTSTAKYEAFDLRSKTDGRLRDILMYHGASTGRWSGVGVQPQNFPRGSIKDTITAAHALAQYDLESIRFLYDSPMEVFSSCLRNMIIAPKGKVLDVADYAAIEARVLFWVADHEEGIKAFREGKKMYEELAAKIFNILVEVVQPDQRFVGKQATLGCGYQMGKEKFKATCEQFGQIISDDLAELAVRAYREAHRPVVKLWDMLNRAAIYAVNNPGTVVKQNHTRWCMKNGFLFCQLPSGRYISYPHASIAYATTSWGERRAVLHYWEVDSYTKKWRQTKTYGGKLTENVVQAISRDLMADAMLRIQETGIWKIVLTVHDELIAEREKHHGSNEQFCELMATVPFWAEGCPVKVEGWEGERYKK